MCSIVHEVCRVMRQVLTQKYIKFPNDNNAQEIICGFSNLGFPQTLGAIDGTHIPIISPGENSSDYYK